MKKKLFCFIVVCFTMLLACCVFSTEEAQAATDYSIVRVKLSIGSPTSYDFKLDGNFALAEKSNLALSRGKYTVKKDGTNVALYNESNQEIYTGKSVSIIRCQAPTGQNNYFTLKNVHYSNKNYNYLGNLKWIVEGGAPVSYTHL